MRRPERRALWVVGFVAFGLAGSAQARDGGVDTGGARSPHARGLAPSDAGSAPARDGGPAAASAPGEPPPISEDDPLPEGHPALDGADGTPAAMGADPEANPHAHTGKVNGMPGVFEPPEDTEKPDTSLLPGSIAVELRDADDHPVANEMVTLGALTNSIAKGDSRKHFQATTDDKGHALFSDLEMAGNVAYRVSSGYQGGSFAATPFQLGQVKAMRVVLHVYPVTRDLTNALIVCEATVAAELRDDRIQIEEALTVYNLGRSAWQPDDVRMGLPDGFTAFNAQASMSDQGVDETGGSAKLRGTFAPGRHALEFRWQLPWSGDRDVDFDVGLPPHVAIARVMMPATSTIKLSAADFPPTDVRRDEQGQSFLVTERRLRPEDAKLTSLSIGIHDLPTPGPGRLIASLLAACGVGAGLLIAGLGRKRGRTLHDKNLKLSRDVLLQELLGLERAHASGQVGPRTYERARREIIESLARALAGPV